MASRDLQRITDLLVKHGYRDPNNNIEIICIHLEGLLNRHSKAMSALDYAYRMNRHLITKGVEEPTPPGS